MLEIYQAKAALLLLRQDNTTNHDCLKRFCNIFGVATEYTSQLHDHPIVDFLTEMNHLGTAYDTLTDENKALIQTVQHKLYMATLFISQADRRIYSKLVEELENYFTKDNDD